MTDLIHLTTLAVTALVTLAVSIIAARTFLRLLSRLALAATAQRMCYEKFYDGLARILKETSDAEHLEMRRALVLFAEKLSEDKGEFAKFYFIKNRNQGMSSNDLQPELAVALKQMAALSQGLKLKLSETVGAGLVASTYDLPFTGWLLRAGMKADSAAQAPTKIHEPENVVTRASVITIAHKHHHHDEVLVAC